MSDPIISQALMINKDLAEASAGTVQAKYHPNYQQLVYSSYYRSKLPQLLQHENKLLMASDGILTLLPRLLLIDPDSNQLQQLRENIIHELQALANQLEVQEYSRDQIFMTHYILCLFIDDTLSKSTFAQRWQEAPLLGTYIQVQEPIINGDPLLQVARYLGQQAPQVSLELLELVYLCFSLGYQPKTEDSFQRVRTELYRLIFYQRGRLSLEKNMNATSTYPSKNKLYFMIAMVALLLSFMFWTYNDLLLGNLLPLQEAIHFIDHEMQSNHEDI
jgi:type IV/VI secretion system ImpK/VasF family protein